MAGLSAGFGSVFGTPLAGAVFGLEVLMIGAINYEAIAPCFIAAFVGDLSTRAWHVQHTTYRVADIPAMNLRGMLWAAVAGMIFGLTAMAFARVTHAIGRLFKARIAWTPARPFFGGIMVAAAVWTLGTTRYIGLGVPAILEAFGPRHRPWDFAAKFVFTVVTLGSGFKGGEVTPLFFIGATLGNALAYLLPLPPSLLAGMGFAAVFGGAANTPIASTLMAMELFGGEVGAYAGIACVTSYLFSGHSGIYSAQRLGRNKGETAEVDAPAGEGKTRVAAEPGRYLL
jgi:H+/Cl- antiporter ClcA